MQYLGTNCYEHPDFPGKVLAPIRNRTGLRLVIPLDEGVRLRGLELYQDKAGNIWKQRVNKSRVLIPPPYTLFSHLTPI